MRFGILSQWFDPEPGPASLPGGLARGLVALGHEVEVVTGFPNYPTGVLADGYQVRPRLVEERDGVRVTRVALYPAHDRSRGRRLLNYGSFAASAAVVGVPTAFRRLDALWVNYSPASLAVPMLAQTMTRRTPSVVHVLDLWPDTVFASGFGVETSPLGRLLRRSLDSVCAAVYRSAVKVAYISPGVGELLAERGVPRERLAYAPMWANERMFGGLPGRRARSFGVRTDNVVLVYAGTLGRAQGLDTLIRACGQLMDLPLTCLVAGSGTEEESLRDLARTVGAANVQFLGRLSEEEMPDLMATSDLQYVSLNQHPLAAVTMPSKLQGVMAAGRPIVGALVGDAARVVEQAGAGWVVPPGDIPALASSLRAATLLGRGELARRGGAARTFYEREFTYELGVRRIESLLTRAARSDR